MRKKLDDLKDELGSEQRKYRNPMKISLGDSVEDHTFDLLFSNIGGKLWSNSRVDDCLWNRLRQDYNIFSKHVTRMSTLVDDMKKSFPVDIEKVSLLRRCHISRC